MISVVVPALNEEDRIQACLLSLKDQSLDRARYEIIVVDGGSEDGTVTVARELADRIILQKSLGIGGARRDGAMAASGEMLAFTDADTEVSHGWLEAVAKNLSRRDASTGPVVYQNPDMQAEMLRRWRDMYRLLYHSNFYYIIGSNMAVRTDAYWSIGGHSEISLLDDYDLSRKLFRHGKRATYDRDQVVYTSSRRTGRLLTYTATVAYGHYHYQVTKDHEKLLHYPKPEEMSLSSLHSSGRRISSSLGSVHASLNRIKRIF